MVDPVSMTVGGLAAAFINEAVEKAAEQAAEGGVGAAGRVWAAVKARFGRRKDDAARALARVEDPPAGAAHIEKLADAIDAEAADAPEWGSTLWQLVEDAKGSVDVSSAVQHAYGDRDVQNANITNSDIDVTYNN